MARSFVFAVLLSRQTDLHLQSQKFTLSNLRLIFVWQKQFVDHSKNKNRLPREQCSGRVSCAFIFDQARHRNWKKLKTNRRQNDLFAQAIISGDGQTQILGAVRDTDEGGFVCLCFLACCCLLLGIMELKQQLKGKQMFMKNTSSTWSE